MGFGFKLGWFEFRVRLCPSIKGPQKQPRSAFQSSGEGITENAESGTWMKAQDKTTTGASTSRGIRGLGFRV